MISYGIQLSGPVPFTVEITFNAGRVPLLDVVGFGPRSDQLKAKLTSGMVSAGFALPCYCRISGPGPKAFREIFSPGLPLGLLVALMDAAHTQVSGDAVTPRYAWGDIVDGKAVPAAGELAVGLEIAERAPGAEFVVPRFVWSGPMVSLGMIERLMSVSIQGDNLSGLAVGSPPHYISRNKYSSRCCAPRSELDAPPLVKLAIELAIAARLPTALVGSPTVLDGWAAYAHACSPPIALGSMLEHEALCGLWSRRIPGLPGAVPCVHVGYKTSHEDLVGEINVAADPPGSAGLLAQAHQGLLLVDQTELAPNGSRGRVADSVLRRIASSALRFASEEKQLRYTVITAMPACACDPPRDLPCRCAGVHAPQIARQRHRVSSWGVGICVWGDGSRGSSQPTLDIDTSSRVVRSRIARAWAAQDAELGVGVRWGEHGGRSGEAGELVSKALGALGFMAADAAVLTPLLATRPW